MPQQRPPDPLPVHVPELPHATLVGPTILALIVVPLPLYATHVCASAVCRLLVTTHRNEKSLMPIRCEYELPPPRLVHA